MKSLLAPYSRLMTVAGLCILTFSVCMALTGCMAPQWLQEVEHIGELIGTLAGSLLTIAGKLTNTPGLETVGEDITLGVEAAQAASTGLTNAIQAYQSDKSAGNLAAVVAAIDATKASLAQIEQIAGVPTVDQSIVSEIIATLTQELESAEAVLPLMTDEAAGQPLPVGNVPNTAAVTTAKVKASLAKLTPATGGDFIR